MLTCFIYHFYAGVRAGGGIGDELESPYGDELEYARMLYDISFFFFVIVILLAIMQGKHAKGGKADKTLPIYGMGLNPPSIRSDNRCIR